jgi:tetratricopeptide (TPR) repeat protein
MPWFLRRLSTLIHDSATHPSGFLFLWRTDLWGFLVAIAVGWCCCAAATEGGPEAAIEELDRLWTERASPAAVERAVVLGRRSVAQHPSSYDLAWRLARAYWRKGDLTTDKAQRRETYATARRYAEASLKLDPDRVEGHCYYALTTGDYGGTLGLVGAARERIGASFEREIKRAYDINRDFDNGSPMLALGRYYFALPWPLRDLNQSRRYLEELKHRHPDVLLGRVYLAETDRALGDDAAAGRELQYVLGHDPMPGRAVEERDIKLDAEQRMREWFGATATPQERRQ